MDGAGTISGRWSLAAGRAAVKGCRICHGPILPGMRLCTQCKAALKRARQETVSEAIPPPLAQARSMRPPRKARSAPIVDTAPARRGLHFAGARTTAVVLSIVAVAALGYAALRFARAVPASFPAPAPVSAASPAAADPAPQPRAEPTVPVATPREALTPFVPPVSASRLVRPAAPKRPPEPPPASPPEPPATARFAAATEPPTPAPVAPPPPRPVPRPDRWQLMADAVAQCGREGFFAGVVCEQRVRLQYCEGYWGQAAQCPSGIANDHGQ